MREINIRQLRANLSKELENLPFAITRNGKIIGYVQESVHNTDDSGDSQLISVHKTFVAKEEPNGINNPALFEPCAKHEGSMKITCGCK